VIKIVKIELLLKMLKLGVRVMVFNDTSVISWQSVVLVEETGENHRPVGSH
jgi:hypothetical protein